MPVGLLPILQNQKLLQGGVIHTLGAGGGQPAIRETGEEDVPMGAPIGHKPLDQQTRCPVIASGIQAIEMAHDQRLNLGQPLLELGDQAPPLTLGSRLKTLKQGFWGGRGGDRRSGKHGRTERAQARYGSLCQESSRDCDAGRGPALTN